MAYLVNLSVRALRDLESIFEFIQACSSPKAFAWFNGLEARIYSLEDNPDRGAGVSERKTLRYVLYGTSSDVYRIIYTVHHKAGIVNILHIRHGSRRPLAREEGINAG
jgi:plasmid stabilization system protein ParE